MRVGVAVVGAAAGVVGGQQHLADADAVAGEGGGVAGDEEALSDAGGGLLAGQVLGAAAQPERGETGGDGTGGDEDDLLLAAAAALGEDVDERVDPVGVEAAGRGGQRRGTDLDDDPVGLCDGLPCPCHLRSVPSGRPDRPARTVRLR